MYAAATASFFGRALLEEDTSSRRNRALAFKERERARKSRYSLVRLAKAAPFSMRRRLLRFGAIVHPLPLRLGGVSYFEFQTAKN